MTDFQARSADGYDGVDAAPPEPSDYTCTSDWIEAAAVYAYRRWEPFYGSLKGAWTGSWSPKPLKQRLHLIAYTILGGQIQRLAPSFRVDVEVNEEDVPISLILTRPSRATMVVDIELTAKRLRIGSTWISLSAPSCGANIVCELAEVAGEYFGPKETPRVS